MNSTQLRESLAYLAGALYAVERYLRDIAAEYPPTSKEAALLGGVADRCADSLGNEEHLGLLDIADLPPRRILAEALDEVGFVMPSAITVHKTPP